MSISPPAEPTQPKATRLLPLKSPKFIPANALRVDGRNYWNGLRKWSVAVRDRFSSSAQTICVAWAVCQRAERHGFCFGSNADLAAFAGGLAEPRVKDALAALERAGLIFRAHVDTGAERDGKLQRRIWMCIPNASAAVGGYGLEGPTGVRSGAPRGVPSVRTLKGKLKDIGRFQKKVRAGKVSSIEASPTPPSPVASNLVAASQSGFRARGRARPPATLFGANLPPAPEGADQRQEGGVILHGATHDED